MVDLPRLQAGVAPSEINAALDDAGCCVIEALATPDLMDAVAAEMAPHVGSTPRGDTDFAGAGTRRTGMLLDLSPTFRTRLVRHEVILSAGDHVLGHAPTWNLSFAQYFELFGGEPTQPLHRDVWKYGHTNFGVEVDLNGLWAITDFTESNGATRLVPGSHRWGDERRPEPGDDVGAVAPKGSLVLYLGRTFHGGGANTGGDVRLAVNVQHGPGWIAPTERLLLEYPPAVVADWDDDLIRFIGYQRSGPATGHWRNAEDPFLAVDEYRRSARQI